MTAYVEALMKSLKTQLNATVHSNKGDTQTLIAGYIALLPKKEKEYVLGIFYDLFGSGQPSEGYVCPKTRDENKAADIKAGLVNKMLFSFQTDLVQSCRHNDPNMIVNIVNSYIGNVDIEAKKRYLNERSIKSFSELYSQDFMNHFEKYVDEHAPGAVVKNAAQNDVVKTQANAMVVRNAKASTNVKKVVDNAVVKEAKMKMKAEANAKKAAEDEAKRAQEEEVRGTLSALLDSVMASLMELPKMIVLSGIQKMKQEYSNIHGKEEYMVTEPRSVGDVTYMVKYVVNDYRAADVECMDNTMKDKSTMQYVDNEMCKIEPKVKYLFDDKTLVQHPYTKHICIPDLIAGRGKKDKITEDLLVSIKMKSNAVSSLAKFDIDLKDILADMKARKAENSGGGVRREKIMFKSTKKIYVVKVDKEKKTKYVMMGGKKVALSSLRGKYVYVK